jgi:hypothetical protein
MFEFPYSNVERGIDILTMQRFLSPDSYLDH